MGFRTGLLKVGIPEPKRPARQNITIAEALKPLGYATGQFGKNHLGTATANWTSRLVVGSSRNRVFGSPEPLPTFGQASAGLANIETGRMLKLMARLSF